LVLASRRKEIKWGHNRIKGEGNPNFSGGKYIDDKGYVRVLSPEHPYQNHGYVYEHRLVIEKMLKRFVEPWETINHINEIKVDNRWENLFLCTPPEHSLIHKHGKKKSLEDKTKLRKNVRTRLAKNGGATRGATGKFVKNPDL
jgi:hypothetical protein